MSVEFACPLCFSRHTHQYFSDKQRDYFQCESCDLVFVPASFWLSAKNEKAEYDLHQNSPDDAGYRKFLSRLFTPMNERLAPQSLGLDFGCGPGPTLSIMFEERGHTVELYDYFYYPDRSVLERQYGFVTATEVVEHLHNPANNWQALWRCVGPGGMLGVMTKLVRSREAFAGWHYKNDPTHVMFYSHRTLHWLADRWHARLDKVADDAFIFVRES